MNEGKKEGTCLCLLSSLTFHYSLLCLPAKAQASETGVLWGGSGAGETIQTPDLKSQNFPARLKMMAGIKF